MGILDDYKLQVQKDEQNDDFPEGSTLTENERESYKEALENLRNNPNSVENAYKTMLNEMKKMTEFEMAELGYIKEEDVTKVTAKRAYCEECGEELISSGPPMFNPFTMERICKHTCPKCGATYNLEFAYPRVAFIDNNGNEIPAFTR